MPTNYDAEEARLKAAIRRATQKLNDLNRKKLIARSRIDRVVGKLQRIGGYNLPQDVARRIENKINGENWMEKIIKARFAAESEHGPGSRKWKDLSPTYRLWRVRHGFGARPILKVTGILRTEAMAAVRGTFSFKGVRWNVDDIPVSYAKYANGPRPFFKDPTNREMKPVMKRARELIRQELRRIARGS